MKTTLENELLAAMLGAVDGLHEPRTLAGAAWQADWQRRKDFQDNGGTLAWSNPGTDAASRKAFTRARAGLVAGGLVALHGDRRAGLTPAGLDEARRLCGLPLLEDALTGLDAIAAAPDSVRWGRDWVSETTLAGLEPFPRRRVGEDRLDEGLAGAVVWGLLPLLVAGLVEWRTGGADGVFLYAPTAAGTAEAATRRADGRADAGRWKQVRRRNDCPPEAYDRAWGEAFNGRETARPLWPNVIQHQDPVDAPKAAR